METKLYSGAGDSDTLPIVLVTWQEAEAYCNWAGGRLPTEAQWELAVRSGLPTERYGALDDIAWYKGNSGGGPKPVAQKQPNAFGLYDMLGNVWEWMADWYDEKYYEGRESVNPIGPATGEFRALRGGSWGSDDRLVRASSRGRGKPGNFGVFTGLRYVRE